MTIQDLKEGLALMGVSLTIVSKTVTIEFKGIVMTVELTLSESDFERALWFLNLNMNNWYKLIKEALAEEGKGNDEVRKVVELYKNTFNGLLPIPKRISSYMCKKVEECLGIFGADTVSEVFEKVKDDKFMLGQNKIGFIADFSYIFDSRNYGRILRSCKSEKGGTLC